MRARTLLATSALVILAALAAPVRAQESAKADEVLRISTELVQTGVMVFDRQGRFVEGLKPEQFEVKVDGKPVTLSFFDRVTAWTEREERQVAQASSGQPQKADASDAPPTRTAQATRGRTVIFFIDDLHLSLDGLGRTRAAVNRFIDHEMTPQDRVAVTSASGQIGFLQKLTDNKAVLRAALARVNHIPYVVLDRDQPPMTEFVAIRILNGDQEARDFYAEELLRRSYRQTKGINRNALYETVKNRANQILVGMENVTANTLGSLENLLRTTGQLAGRKLIFFISDGFYLDTKNSSSGANERFRHVIDTATRTGSVIYTIDARGLFAPMADAAGERPFDPSGRLDRASVGEGTLSQDGLNALAGDTGGRFLKNQNYFDQWVTRMLDETSNYYLLAWRPPAEEQRGGNFKRVQVSVVGRPDLTVRLPRGFLAGGAKSKPTDAKRPAADAASPKPDAELLAALGAPSARRALPTQLSVSYVDVPGAGPVLTASTQVATGVLGYGADGKQAAALDLAGVVVDDRGKTVGGFKNRLNVNPLAGAAEDGGVIYSHKVPLKPGLYQVRVAARDEKTGRVGSDAQWIEVPDLSTKRLTLSSLLVGGQFVGSGQKEAGASEQVQFSVDRRFKSGSHLNFLTIIYNAAQGPNGAPDLEAQIRISRDGRTIVNSPARKIGLPQGTDLARIPYGADIGLNNLPPGRYLLQVTVNDRAAKTSATQQTTFDIE